MLRNHLKIAWRNLKKDPYYTLLNILGLAIGLCCFAFILFWTGHEQSYDRFHSKADRTYRIAGQVTTDAETFAQATTAAPVAPALQRDMPEIEAALRLDKNDAIIRVADKQFSEDNIFFTDPAFFDIFDYNMLLGDPATCLETPYSIVLTASAAKKYFRYEDPIGKSMTMLLYDPGNNGAPYTVTGVVEDPPVNSHFQFSILGSLSTVAAVRPDFENDWQETDLYSYILLKDHADKTVLEEKLPVWTDRNFMSKQADSDISMEFSLQPIRDIHLHSDLRYEIQSNGDPRYVYLFSSIGWLVLLMAGINYVNLATARSMRRMEEISIRKILGARRFQLVVQVITESVLVSMSALAVSLLFVELLKPVFIAVTGIVVPGFGQLSVWLPLVGTATLLGITAGIYPALQISKFGSAGSLANLSKDHLRLRRVLVIFQFTVCIAMVIGLFVIQLQMDYVQHKNLGFATDAKMLLKVNGSREVLDNFAAFRNEVLARPFVNGVGLSNSTPAGNLDNARTETFDTQGKSIASSIYQLQVDPDFFDLYDISFLAGRPFAADAASDSIGNFVINEAAVTSFGWPNPEAAIGKPFTQEERSGVITGVIRDFHYNSLKHKVAPLAFSPVGRGFSQITVALSATDLSTQVASVEGIWQKHFPGSFLEYRFLNDRLASQYQAEQKMGQLFGSFFALALFIALFGLLGLSAYTAELRTKEIGIRKVLGASVGGIVTLLSKDYIQLVAIAVLIATPVGWYLMQKWLAGFAYRIEMHWWIFVVAGLSTALAAFVTVGFQSVRVALINPIESLKDE